MGATNLSPVGLMYGLASLTPCILFRSPPSNPLTGFWYGICQTVLVAEPESKIRRETCASVPGQLVQPVVMCNPSFISVSAMLTKHHVRKALSGLDATIPCKIFRLMMAYFRNTGNRKEIYRKVTDTLELIKSGWHHHRSSLLYAPSRTCLVVDFIDCVVSFHSLRMEIPQCYSLDIFS